MPSATPTSRPCGSKRGSGPAGGDEPRAMSATPAATIAALTPQTQRASRAAAAAGHGAGLRRCGGLPAMPSSGTGERTSVFSTTFPRGAVASPLAAVGVGRASGLPGAPPQVS